MGNPIKDFLFGGAGAATRFGNIGLLILRAGFGLAIAIGHGMGKVYSNGSIGPSDQFVNGVKGMGFPAPTAMAWMAALTEFLGGILLAAGLLTRPAAIALVFNMGVAAFVAHKDAPLFGPPPNKEYALLFLVVFLAFVFTGAGRYSIDRFLRKSSSPRGFPAHD
jgi:putative oxidoreductase